jgi:hypothetical protein
MPLVWVSQEMPGNSRAVIHELSGHKLEITRSEADKGYELRVEGTRTKAPSASEDQTDSVEELPVGLSDVVIVGPRVVRGERLQCVERLRVHKSSVQRAKKDGSMRDRGRAKHAPARVYPSSKASKQFPARFRSDAKNGETGSLDQRGTELETLEHGDGIRKQIAQTENPMTYVVHGVRREVLMEDIRRHCS